jgi:hypothetical protein
MQTSNVHLLLIGSFIYSCFQYINYLHYLATLKYTHAGAKKFRHDSSQQET